MRLSYLRSTFFFFFFPFFFSLVQTYPVDDGAAHASYHRDAAAVTETNHLFCCSLSRHEHACDVDLEHGIGVLCGVFQSRCLLLHTCGSEKTIKTAFLGADAADDRIQVFDITNVDLRVMELGAKLLFGTLLDTVEIRGLGVCVRFRVSITLELHELLGIMENGRKHSTPTQRQMMRVGLLFALSVPVQEDDPGHKLGGWSLMLAGVHVLVNARDHITAIR